MDKANYQKRLEYCRHKANCHNADSEGWRIASEVYEHLIECPFTHHGPRPTCKWQADGVEK